MAFHATEKAGSLHTNPATNGIIAAAAAAAAAAEPHRGVAVQVAFDKRKC
jgi:hypothetical protein